MKTNNLWFVKGLKEIKEYFVNSGEGNLVKEIVEPVEKIASSIGYKIESISEVNTEAGDGEYLMTMALLKLLEDKKPSFENEGEDGACNSFYLMMGEYVFVENIIPGMYCVWCLKLTKEV